MKTYKTLTYQDGKPTLHELLVANKAIAGERGVYGFMASVPMWKLLARFHGAAQNVLVATPRLAAELHSHGIVPIARALGDYRYRVYFSPRDRQNRSNVSWLDIAILSSVMPAKSQK